MCILTVTHAVSMERVDISNDNRHNSTEIVVLETITTSHELKETIKKYDNWKSFTDNCDIKPRALAEYLLFKETAHQIVDEEVVKEFENFHLNHPQYYRLCVQDLMKEIYTASDDNKTNCILLDIQQQFRRNIVNNIYDVKGQIRQIEPEYKKLKRNYLIYVVRTCTFSTISLLGFIGIGYFGWVFHHCSEKG